MLLKTESWTATHVLAHFEVAAATLRLLNMDGQRPLRAYWPAMRRDQREMWAQAVTCGRWKALASRRRVATSEELRILDEVLVWSGWITDLRARKLVCGRAFGVPWRVLTHKVGLGRTWGQRLVTEALIQVAWHLNQTGEPLIMTNQGFPRAPGSLVRVPIGHAGAARRKSGFTAYWHRVK